MSGVGKSILTAGILRVLKQDGYRVAPFKSQNMALNSFATLDGKEIGRAQALQAIAAGRAACSDMNPILLKPTGERASQVIVNGLPIGDMDAREYFGNKKKYVPDIMAAYERLASDSDVIVIEGAGSPVEINLRAEDIVNMGMAQLVDAPVMLVGNIDPGGVFAQLLGTVKLMPEDEQKRIKGLIINKFRGDVTLLTPGLEMFREYCDIPFAGVVPYMELKLDEEDSLSDKLQTSDGFSGGDSVVKMAVIRLPFISNYTDYSIFEDLEGVEIIYTQDAKAIADADLVIIPGTKNTLADLQWMKEKELDKAVTAAKEKGVVIVGICGGFQILGRSLKDGSGEGGGDTGLCLLPVDTTFMEEKNLRQVEGTLNGLDGAFKALNGKYFEGYEIHMGETSADREIFPVITKGNVLGTYIHGFFDEEEIAGAIMKTLFERKNIKREVPKIESHRKTQERELDRLADCLRKNLDMDLIYRAIGL